MLKKAVLCFAHKCPAQINVLVDQLLYGTCGNTDVFIHLDKNHDSLKSEILERNNLFFIKNSVGIKWGNDSMIDALVASFKEILEQGRSYDYFVICTGQDLLVKPGLDDYLEKNKGKIWLDIRGRSDYQKRKLLHKFPDFMCSYLKNKYDIRRILRSIYVRLICKGLIPQRHIDYDVTHTDFYYSFNWSVMPYETLTYIYDFVCNNPEFMKLFHNTLLPEDGFLGTVVMNSPYSNRVVFDTQEKSSSLTFWSGVLIDHMKTLTSDDINEIELSGCFFARKFDLEIDNRVVHYFRRKIIDS